MYRLGLPANMHLNADHAAQVHNDRCHMRMVQYLIGKSLACVCHLDNFHLLIVHYLVSLILDARKRSDHSNRVRCDTVRSDIVVHAAAVGLDAVLDGNFGMHMLMGVYYLR